jgi:chromosome partitioning protein
VIPRNVRLAEAPSFGKPIVLYDILSAGAQSYLTLANEVIGHDGMPDGTLTMVRGES